MFFVLSTGRSGSTSIANYLNRSTDAVCLHEPEPILLRESIAYLYGTISQDEIGKLLRTTRQDKGDKRYGESNFTLGNMIPVLKHTFPDAQYIFLIRNGIPTVASFYARHWYETTFRFPNRHDLSRFKWTVNRLNGAQTGNVSFWEWWTMTQFEKCCWHWAYKNELILKHLEELSCDWVSIRLEDLDTEGQKLFDFLNIKKPDTLMVSHLNKSNSSEAPPTYDTWSELQKAAFHHFCGEMMEKWYPEWQPEAVIEWSKLYNNSRIERVIMGIKSFMMDSLWLLVLTLEIHTGFLYKVKRQSSRGFLAFKRRLSEWWMNIR